MLASGVNLPGVYVTLNSYIVKSDYSDASKSWEKSMWKLSVCIPDLSYTKYRNKIFTLACKMGLNVV